MKKVLLVLFFVHLFFFSTIDWGLLLGSYLILSIGIFLLTTMLYLVMKAFGTRTGYVGYVRRGVIIGIWLFLFLEAMYLGTLVYYNEISPGVSPRIELSNGEKTVVFQTMSHIGRDEFYQDVLQDLAYYKEQGAVYFYEWVKSGSEESMQKLHQALGMEITPESYVELAKLFGLASQLDYEFLWLVNENDINVDISIDEIIDRHETRLDALGDIPVSTEILSIDEEIKKEYDSLSNTQRTWFRYNLQALMSLVMSHESNMYEVIEQQGVWSIFGVILHDRNEVLADAIVDSSSEKIYVTYGLLHFNGVYELLQRKDSRWNIISIESKYPIREPRF